MPHMEGTKTPSVCERKTELFDHWVGEHFPGDALDLRLSLVTRKAAIESEFKVLALTHVCQAFVAHFLERALDGLSLWIEDAFFERYVYVGRHVDKTLY